MGWIGWAVLAAVGVAVGVLVRFLYSEDGGAHPCCGCGRCLETGRCVFQKKREKEKNQSKPS